MEEINTKSVNKQYLEPFESKYEKNMDHTPSLKYFIKMTEEEFKKELDLLNLKLIQQYLVGENSCLTFGALKSRVYWENLIFYTQYNEPYTDYKNTHTYKRVIDLTESPKCKETAFLVLKNSVSMYSDKPAIIDPHGIMSLVTTYTTYFLIEDVMKWLASTKQGREDIMKLAHTKWKAAGEPTGRDAEFWIAAEKDFRSMSFKSTSFGKYNHHCDVDKELIRRAAEQFSCLDVIKNSFYTSNIEVVGNEFKVTIREGPPKPEQKTL